MDPQALRPLGQALKPFWQALYPFWQALRLQQLAFSSLEQALRPHWQALIVWLNLSIYSNLIYRGETGLNF